MNVFAACLVALFGLVAAQPDPFGEFPDYGDQMVGSMVGNSGENTGFNAYEAAGAGAAGFGGAGAGGMGGVGGTGGGGGFMGQGQGQGRGNSVGYNGGQQQGFPGNGAGYGTGYGANPGQRFGGAVVPAAGGGTGMGGSPYGTGAFGGADRLPSNNNNPHLVKNASGRAQAVSASTVAGATIAVIVIVVVFAGIAFFVVKQRRNSRMAISSA